MTADVKTFTIRRRALLIGPGLLFALSAIVLVSDRTLVQGCSTG
jgi:hypothetical protein